MAITANKASADDISAGTDIVRGDTYVHATAQQYQERVPSADPVAIEIALGIHISHSVAQEARTRLVSSFGLGRTGGRYSVLRSLYLAEEEYLTAHELARRLSVTPASVTFLVDGLEQDGLVTRTVDESDRRSRRIELTEHGQETCRRIVPEVAALMNRFCDGFTDSEKAVFVDLLMRFWRNASSEVK